MKTTSRYSSIEQLFHWSTAVLVLTAFLYAPGGHGVYSAARDAGRRLHETLGLSVLGLTVLRLCWRTITVRPKVPTAARWMGLTSIVVQGLLYALLFAVPLTAIAGAWLQGHPVTWLLGDIQPWLRESRASGELVVKAHRWLGDTIMWLAGLHAAAALFHHFVLRDGILLSMLPGRGSL